MRNLQIFFSSLVLVTVFVWCLVVSRISLADDASNVLVTINDTVNFDTAKFDKAIKSALMINHDTVLTVTVSNEVAAGKILKVLENNGIKQSHMHLTTSDKLGLHEALVTVAACKDSCESK